MSKTWIIWSLLFILAGAGGLGGIYVTRYRDNFQTEAYKSRYSEDNDEFLKLYNEWCQLSPSQKTENPWGKGKYKTETSPEQLLTEQAGRLKADIADLSTGAKEPHILADVLYGENWPSKVAEYRRGQEIMDSISIASLISLLAGCIIFTGVFLKFTLYKVSKRSKGTKAAREADSEASVKSKTEKPVSKEAEVKVKAKSPVKLVSLIEPRSEDNDTKSEHNTKKKVKAKDKPALETKAEPPTPRQQDIQKYGLSGLEFKESLRSKAEGYKNKGLELKQLAEDSNVATLMSTDPVTDNLTELTEQVSAIREFAAQQQDRVRQLQDGYDWNIIKRFCLRIIRCVDNLDDRITKMADAGEQTDLMEDVRDELVFALESSGVEQFEPELKSNYKGLEKQVEAIRQRIKTKDPALKGLIASIVKPGYQYVVSDDEVKIVRCSQVMLYE